MCTHALCASTLWANTVGAHLDLPKLLLVLFDGAVRETLDDFSLASLADDELRGGRCRRRIRRFARWGAYRRVEGSGQARGRSRSVGGLGCTPGTQLIELASRPRYPLRPATRACTTSQEASTLRHPSQHVSISGTFPRRKSRRRRRYFSSRLATCILESTLQAPLAQQAFGFIGSFLF